ncbi:MAG TPA: exosortase U [Planctomycetaceae bacterium]|nr:exosortase U [Planctomycetaceae bacterium]
MATATPESQVDFSDLRRPYLYGSAWRALIASGLLLVAHAPFLLLYFRDLWFYHPHYEFFPVVLVSVVALFVLRWPRRETDASPFPSRLSHLLLFSSFICLAGAVLLVFPWLAAVAAILAVGGAVTAMVDRRAVKDLLPVWLLLWLVIHPPREFDTRLVRALQSVAVRYSGRVLDLFGVHHLLSGNVIQLPDRDLLVAEACSGIHSQLALIACATVFLVVVRRSWLHSLLVIAAAVFWAAVANVGRILAVAFSWTALRVDLAEGWKHDALGYFFVGCGFAALLSTDQLLVALLGKVPVNDPSDVNPLTSWWNRFVAREDAKRTSGPRHRSQTDARPDQDGWPARVHRGWLGAFAGLGILQVLILVLSSGDGVIFPGEFDLSIGRTIAPSTICGRNQIDYQCQRRPDPRTLAAVDHLWRYEGPEGKALVSVTYPFLSWHELPLCYEAQGWQIEDRQVIRREAPAGGDESFLRVRLASREGRQAWLFFALLRGDGATVAPPSTELAVVLRRALNRFALNPIWSSLGTNRAAGGLLSPHVQVQCFVMGRIAEVQRNQQLEELEKTFRGVCQRVRESCEQRRRR